MNDEALEAALYASRRSKRGHRRIEEPDWAGVRRELKRKHVTLMILWDECIAANPGGYSYSRFCELYRSFEKTLSVTMRQTHAAGERLFVDYAGDGVPVIIDRLTGEIRMAQIFVAVLGASSFTFAKATWTQALPDWIDAHVRAFEAIGGVPDLVVPDNARTAIVKASFYDPQVNRTYADMAAHYGSAILPARPRKPRDKAKVEQAVLIVERWLLGRLRRRTFISLADVDAALGELMTQLNEKQILRRLGVTRRQLLEEIDRPALNALPDEPYEYSEWRVRRVGVDYHVDIDAHYYSVPYRFARAEVEALERIAALYAIEKTIRGASADERRRVRQEKSKPLVMAFRPWLEHQLARVSGKSGIAEELRYRCPQRLAPDRPPKAHIPHQPRHRAASGADALPPQLTPNLTHAIDTKVLLEHAPDLDLQIGVSADPVGQTGGIGSPGEMGAISRRGDRQNPADRLDPVGLTMIVDERNHGLNRKEIRELRAPPGRNKQTPCEGSHSPAGVLGSHAPAPGSGRARPWSCQAARPCHVRPAASSAAVSRPCSQSSPRSS